MWALDNQTRFAADRSWVRDRDGAEVWLVAVKGTFEIEPDGTTKVADDQVEIYLSPKYSGEPGKSSLLYDLDLPRTKVTTDVLLNGHAYAPGGLAATTVQAGFRIGDLQKYLRVTGDRVWRSGLLGINLGKCEPFTRVPISYERSYGGTDTKAKEPKWDPRNPVGTGFVARRKHLAGQLAPNIHAASTGWTRFSRARPAGFGAIPSNWLPRVKFAGTCDAKWEAERAPLLPEDFDDRFYQCAPPDQQTKQFLKGGEQVELHNLTPNGYLAFQLPRVVLGFETDFGSEKVYHRANIHTVVLEPDFPRVLMVWHTALLCHPKVTKLRRTRIIEKRLLSREKPDASAEVESEIFA
jgi:hypothetical protein